MSPSNPNDPPSTDSNLTAAFALPSAENATETVKLSLAEAAMLPPMAAPTVVDRLSVPGYEILGELGRGGMGVVYKARHLGLNRLVALKMILAGGHAGRDELTRFRSEAEAIARLNHPNIVQIHDIGESGGLPYFSLEFVEGGSLHHKLNGTPLPTDEASKLVETLARAMAAAHAAGLVHRDLKPANVLLSTDGMPKVTDFGLVKKLDAAGQTASGAIMGTPSYMAPEQAGGGKSHEIGPACDVYALGAILYECLTGRPPFKAATPMDTIMQVVNEEPVPARQLNMRVPVDLETICLKCLQKEAARRYESASALADDLRRFVERRPILARPLGRLGRAAKWVRRNPVVAGLSAGLVLALLTGIALSTSFGLDARAQAEQAQKEKADAIDKGKKLATANVDLERSRDDVEKALARSILRPLALQVQPGQPVSPLSDPEIDSLWDLASSKDDRLRLRFVGEALRGPIPNRQLKDRAEVALQATVGLDRARRKQVEQMLGERLQENGVTQEEQIDVALTLAQLGIRDRQLAAQCAVMLSKAMTQTKEPDSLGSLSRSPSAVAARMEPKEAAATLTQAMTQTKVPYALGQLSQSLSVVTARMEPKEAATICGQAAVTLTQAMTQTNDPSAMQYLSEDLSSLAGRMGPEEASLICGQAAATLTQTMRQTTDPNVLKALSEGLLAVVGWLEPNEASQIAATLTLNMHKTTDPGALCYLLSRDLSAVAARMKPKEASFVCGQAAATLTQTMSQVRDPKVLKSLSEGLAAVAVWMEPKEAAEAATTLTRTMSQVWDPKVLQSLSEGLAAVAVLIETKEAAQAAATLSWTMSQTKDPVALKYLSQGLSAVAVRMEPKEAAATLTQTMSQSKDPKVLKSLSEVLAAVVVRMEPKKPAEAPTTRQGMVSYDAVLGLVGPLPLGEIMSQVRWLSQGTEEDVRMRRQAAASEAASDAARLIIRMSGSSPNELKSASKQLALLAARMESKKAAVVCGQAGAILIQAMSKTTDFQDLQSLSEGLAAVAARMETKEAAQAAATLTQTMSKTKDPNVLQSLSEGLAAVAARMETKEAAEAATILIQTMSKTPSPYWLPFLSQGLSAVAARMESKEAAVVCGRAGAILIQAMSETTDIQDLRSLSEGLAAVAARMETEEAAQAAATLTQTMSKTKDPNVLLTLSEGLAAVAARMEPKAVALAAAMLTPTMSKTGDAYAVKSLSRGLSALAERMEPKVADQCAAILTQATSKTTDIQDLQSLSEGLTAVAARMEPKAVALAAAMLTPTMSKTGDAYAVKSLSRGLSALAERMEPKVADQCAAILTQAMSHTKDPIALEYLSQGLSAVASRMEPRKAAVFCGQAAAILTQTMSKDGTVLYYLSEDLPALVARMEPKVSAVVCGQAAANLVQAMSKTTDPNTLDKLAKSLSTILSREPRSSARKSALSVTATVGVLADPGMPFATLAFLLRALEPTPPPLPAQMLVDLLKHPLCVGEARRVVLEQLTRHYNRPFADQWEFVDFVHEQNLDLDLTTPPQRPQMVGSGR